MNVKVLEWKRQSKEERKRGGRGIETEEKPQRYSFNVPGYFENNGQELDKNMPIKSLKRVFIPC